jgi:hypothetical protein
MPLSKIPKRPPKANSSLSDRATGVVRPVSEFFRKLGPIRPRQLSSGRSGRCKTILFDFAVSGIRVNDHTAANIFAGRPSSST